MKEVRPKNIKAAAVSTKVEEYDTEMQEVEVELDEDLIAKLESQFICRFY